MSSKYIDFFESRKKDEKDKTRKKANHVSFDDSYTLPKYVKTRDSVEKGFKDYLSHTEDRRRGYISPPFEVSKVPSPIYGYHKPRKKADNVVDYDRLKAEMRKDKSELILYEEYVSDKEKERAPENPNIQSMSTEKKVKKRVSKINSKKLNKKTFGLNRTLESIIEEERSGNNSEKRNVPGLFDYRDKT